MYKIKNLPNGSTAFIRTNLDGTESGIPLDPDNTDYQQYLAWLAEGNEPLPADEPPAAE